MLILNEIARTAPAKCFECSCEHHSREYYDNPAKPKLKFDVSKRKIGSFVRMR